MPLLPYSSRHVPPSVASDSSAAFAILMPSGLDTVNPRLTVPFGLMCAVPRALHAHRSGTACRCRSARRSFLLFDLERDDVAIRREPPLECAQHLRGAHTRPQRDRQPNHEQTLRSHRTHPHESRGLGALQDSEDVLPFELGASGRNVSSSRKRQAVQRAARPASPGWPRPAPFLLWPAHRRRSARGAAAGARRCASPACRCRIPARVGLTHGDRRELAGLADRDEAGAQRTGYRRAQDEATTLDAHDVRDARTHEGAVIAAIVSRNPSGSCRSVVMS